MSPVGRVVSGLATTVAMVLTLAGCGSDDAITAAPQASAPACTALTGRLPTTVLGRSRTALKVAGAAAWGDPAIVLRCGVPPTGPTTDQCLEANGLDWVITDTKDAVRYVSYGRTPAVEVTVPAAVGPANASGALIDLAEAVRPLPVSTTCIGP